MGKTALVTGASRGLGRQVAVDLAELGALVAINYASNAAAAAETLAMVEAAGGQGFVVQGLLGSFESAEQLAATLDREFTARTGSNGIDILINNAGGGVLANLEQTTPEILEKTVADNFTGPFYVTKVLLPRLRDGGRIVNLSSQAASMALSEFIVYSMCKAAINTFTRAVARDLRPRNITVNGIMPGMIATDSNADIRANTEMVAYFTSQTLAGRIGQPSDISGTVKALVSPGMSFVTGQVFEVSGGLGV
jgi:3-oxoacyl-[acyl-carrier protein] reductase